MKSISLKWIMLAALFVYSCASFQQQRIVASCDTASSTQSYSKAAALSAVLKDLLDAGVPGYSLAVHTKEGWWESSGGFAKIENKTGMQACHLQYLQSVAKTFMAVGILKLFEQGRIDLQAPITQYLPQHHAQYITGGNRITVMMLLNHTSGIPEYNSQPAYVTKLLQHPQHVFQSADYLKFISGKPLDFEPGSKFSYRNTNYLLLALIADAITGNHGAFLNEVIIKPLHLEHTLYLPETGYKNLPRLVNCYWDRYGNGAVENVSSMQLVNVASLVGDDGIVSTPEDAVQFLKGLLEGRLLQSGTMALMKTWVNDSKGNPAYGLGLDYATFQGQVAYGHSGGGLGAGCNLYYFPEQDLYIFIAINLGTITEGPIHAKAKKILDRFYQVLLTPPNDADVSNTTP